MNNKSKYRNIPGRSSYNNDYNRKNKGGYNYNIERNDVKESLLDYIYTNIDLSSFKFKLLEVEEDLLNIKNNFVLSPNYNGTNSLLVFTKLSGNYYSFLLDRKMLSYNKSQINITNVTLVPIRIRLDINIYRGTIMDGIVLHSHDTNKTQFIVNDIYMFRGDNISSAKLIYKELNLRSYLNSELVNDDNINNIKLIPNKVYKLNKIKEFIEQESDKLYRSEEIKGLSFYPELSGTKLIYLYNNMSYKESNQQVQNTPAHTVQTTKTNVITKEKQLEDTDEISVNDGHECVFEMRITGVYDVYKIYLLKKVVKNNKKNIKSKKIGIAYIPTEACSKMCKEMLEEKDKILVDCKYSKEKNKWIPIRKSVNKRPSYVYELYKNSND